MVPSPRPPAWAGWVPALFLLAACAAQGAGTRPPDKVVRLAKAALALPDTAWSKEEQARHLLNRAAFGPSPADLEEVLRLGPATWLDAQLHPETLDDPAVTARLAAYETLTQSSEALMQSHPPLKVQARRAGLDVAALKEDPDARRRMREAVSADQLPGRVVQELAMARLVRAVESRRQLNEVLVDFWFNHFNVSAQKGPVKWMVTSYERDALRPHVFGTFRELLGAVAHHPAMLFYLDNWTSTKEGVTRAEVLRGRPGRNPKANQPLGLNENYARELLELHTLGVDGGYTQADVREVARAFTGWSIQRPRRRPVFVFRPRAHDGGPKKILGVRFPAGGGEADGERVLDLLARHPSTAQFIALKLCRKLVADDPPDALVAQVADVFLRTGGDLRAVYTAILTSKAFWSDAARDAKTRTPLEFAVAAVRATGGTVEDPRRLVREVARLGEPLFRAQAPTGHPEVASRWINAGALVRRINFGLALAHGRVRGVRVALGEPGDRAGPKEADRVIDQVARRLGLGRVSDKTRAVIRKALAPTEEARVADGERRRIDPRFVAGLLLGSPEFQSQ